LQLGERARKQAGLNPSLLDLDGTLIESVYQPVLAWSETLHELKINLPPANRKGMTYVGEASSLGKVCIITGTGGEYWP